MAMMISHTRMTKSIQLNFFLSIMFASPPCPSPKGEGSEMLFKGLIICHTPDGGIYSPRPLERGQGVRLLKRRCTTDGCLLCLSGTPFPSGEGWGEASFSLPFRGGLGRGFLPPPLQGRAGERLFFGQAPWACSPGAPPELYGGIGG